VNRPPDEQQHYDDAPANMPQWAASWPRMPCNGIEVSAQHALQGLRGRDDLGMLEEQFTTLEEDGD
jgi:hypothetical protein